MNSPTQEEINELQRELAALKNGEEAVFVRLSVRSSYPMTEKFIEIETEDGKSVKVPSRMEGMHRLIGPLYTHSTPVLESFARLLAEVKRVLQSTFTLEQVKEEARAAFREATGHFLPAAPEAAVDWNFEDYWERKSPTQPPGSDVELGLPPVGWEGWYTSIGGKKWFWCRVVAHDKGKAVVVTITDHYHARGLDKFVFSENPAGGQKR